MNTFPKIAVEISRWLQCNRIVPVQGVTVAIVVESAEHMACLQRALDSELRPSITTDYTQSYGITDMTIAGISFRFRLDLKGNK